MDNRDLTLLEKLERSKRRKIALKLHEIEGNPFTEQDVAFLENMDALGLMGDDRIDYLKTHFTKLYGGK